MQQQQQPCSSREMQGMASITASLNASQTPLQQLQNNQQQQIANPQIQLQQQQSSHFDQPSYDDSFDQMFSTLPSWSELPSNPNKSPFLSLISQATKLRDLSDDPSPPHHAENHLRYPYDDSSLLASRLQQHQISGNSTAGISSPSGKLMLLQQQQLLIPRGGGGGIARSPPSAGDPGLLPLPLSLASTESSDSAGDCSVPGLYSNGFAGSLSRAAQTANQQQFLPPQNYGAPAAGITQAPASGGGAAPARQRVRARRGQATDPHSIAERLRRERIAERMKALQELVPNANKTDKASMLDEIIDYVKFLQLQVKVLSMSRLGGAAAVAPLVADISSEVSAMGRSGNGANTASSNDSIAVTEHQVAKLMEEDMGSAMQYLQGKGLCLMPISLASAISTATSHPRPHPSSASALMGATAADGPPSPSMSVLTGQSAMGNGGETDVSRSSVKDAASVSKP